MTHETKVPEQLAAFIIIIVKVWPAISRREPREDFHTHFLKRFLTTTVKSKSKTIRRYRKHKADISAQSVTLPRTDTYAALLLLVPFGTTAPPPAWVPLAPIPRFGSGNSINNTERCNVAQMTGDFLLCLEH